MIIVKATREGLSGGKTSTGYVIEGSTPFVALPSVCALRQWVRLRNPKNGRTCRALVLDVGPWNEQDHAYVFQMVTTGNASLLKEARPQAESGVDSRGRKTNGAGIDLGEAVWTALDMADNGDVEWEFM